MGIIAQAENAESISTGPAGNIEYLYLLIQ